MVNSNSGENVDSTHILIPNDNEKETNQYFWCLPGANVLRIVFYLTAILIFGLLIGLVLTDSVWAKSYKHDYQQKYDSSSVTEITTDATMFLVYCLSICLFPSIVLINYFVLRSMYSNTKIHEVDPTETAKQRSSRSGLQDLEKRRIMKVTMAIVACFLLCLVFIEFRRDWSQSLSTNINKTEDSDKTRQLKSLKQLLPVSKVSHVQQKETNSMVKRRKELHKIMIVMFLFCFSIHFSILSLLCCQVCGKKIDKTDIQTI